jgi:hypothetical protein
MRNCDRRSVNYRAGLAHRRCEKKHSDKNKKITFTKEVDDYVTHCFKMITAPNRSLVRLHWTV